MFSSIDMTCNFLIKKNNTTPSPVTVIEEINIEQPVVEETNIGPLVKPIVSSYYEKNDDLLEPLNDDTTIKEIIIKNEEENFYSMNDIKENNDTDNEVNNELISNQDNDKTDIVTVSTESTNDETTNESDTNTQIVKKKRNKAKTKK